MKLKGRTTSTYAHEVLCIVKYDRKDIEGIAFGKWQKPDTEDKKGKITKGGLYYCVSMSKSQLAEAGIEQRGPSIIRMFHESLVSFPKGLVGQKIVHEEDNNKIVNLSMKELAKIDVEEEVTEKPKKRTKSKESEELEL